jgi:DNA-binding NarL/FixJ family response regulator
LPKQEITSAKIVSDLILQSSNSNKKSNRRLQGPNAFDSDLNDREIDLMQHIASGYSNIKIARIFRIEVKSCENAISRLLKKLKIPPDSETNQRILVARKYFELSGIVIV